jgi:hypothetical protein
MAGGGRGRKAGLRSIPAEGGRNGTQTTGVWSQPVGTQDLSCGTSARATNYIPLQLCPKDALLSLLSCMKS